MTRDNYKTLIIARPRDVSDGEATTEINLAYAAHLRDHSVSMMYPEDFYIKDNKLSGITRRPNAERINSIESYAEYMSNENHTISQPVPLESFDTIFSRVVYKSLEEKDSFNNMLTYLATLQTLHPNIAILNDPVGIMKAGPKIYDTLMFSENIPRTQVTKDPERLRKIMAKANMNKVKLVGKPTDGMGGASIMPIPGSSYATYAELLVRPLGSDKYIPTIIQDIVEGVDRRIFLLNGNIIGGYKRVPAEEDFRANFSTGGTIEPYNIQDVDIEIAGNIKDKIVKDGLYFCGLDIIGPEENGTPENTKILELNVRCPAGIKNLETIVREEASSDIIKFSERLSNRKSKKKAK
tara:strand:- start:6261 stop:7316 length:1056 start_codon:yes stop_codon:yes gene_type:complete